jgi:hypothetical protein
MFRKLILIACLLMLSTSAVHTRRAVCGGASPNLTASDGTALADCAATYTEGDTITVTDNIIVSSNVTFSRGGFTLTAATECGVSIAHNAGGAHMLSISRDLTHDTIVKNLRFIEGVSHGAGTGAYYIGVGGPGPATATNYNPILIHDNCFEFEDGQLDGGIRVGVVGGVIIYDNTFTAMRTTSSPSQACNGGQCDQAINFTAEAASYDVSWTTAHTMGTADTDGMQNVYIEGNTFTRFLNQAIDTSGNSRVVFRYNTMNESAGAAHGADTGPDGMRHVEYYNNTFIHDYRGDAGTGCTLTLPVSRALNLRGGTAVLTDNDFSQVENDSCWNSVANNFNIEIQNLRRKDAVYECWGAGAAAQTYDPTIEATYLNATYPAFHQAGRGTYTGANPLVDTGALDPIYIWNNTNMDVGLVNYATTPAECGPDQASITDYVQLNRDYYLSARPSYTKYTYPHPLREAAAPAADPTGRVKVGRRLRGEN